jgi:hypothetical protein
MGSAYGTQSGTGVEDAQVPACYFLCLFNPECCPPAPGLKR